MLDLRAIQRILAPYGEEWGAPVREFDIGGRHFPFNSSPALVGVINLSQDSWYRESVCRTAEEAITRGLALSKAGADLVDIGAESTLPDARRVDIQEQQESLVPVVQALCKQAVLVSVESYYPEVLDAVGAAGAAVFNLTGAAHEDEVLKIAAKHKAAVILCYVQGETPRDVGAFSFAEDMMAEIEAHFQERIRKAQALGVERIIVDPGLGFYYGNLQDGERRIAHQLEVFLHTARLNKLGYPTMNILPHAPEVFGEDHRRAAEPFFAVLAMLGGTHVLRTHEVEVVAKVRQMLSLYPTG